MMGIKTAPPLTSFRNWRRCSVDLRSSDMVLLQISAFRGYGQLSGGFWESGGRIARPKPIHTPKATAGTKNQSRTITGGCSALKLSPIRRMELRRKTAHAATTSNANSATCAAKDHVGGADTNLVASSQCIKNSQGQFCFSPQSVTYTGAPPTNGRFCATSGKNPTGGVGCPTVDILKRDSTP